LKNEAIQLLFGEKCIRLEGSTLEKIKKFSEAGEIKTISDFPGLDTDLIYLLGEYHCGNLEHEYSRCLMEFKDIGGRFGRQRGKRLHAERFARCVAAVILSDPRLGEYSLIVTVPPKIDQDPEDYHLFALADEIETLLGSDSKGKHWRIAKDALRFKALVPPIKQVPLDKRLSIMEGQVECKINLNKRNVILLDDIIASGATSYECIRAMRAKCCGKITVIALAKRVE